MSLDTIKLKSPALSARTIEKIECLHSSKRKISVGTSHGDIEHQFVAASLKSSFDSSVSMKIEQYCRGNVEGRQVKVPCAPYLIVECSIHKVMAGHNIYGGPQDVAASIRWLIAFLSNAIGEELPPAVNAGIHLTHQSRNKIDPPVHLASNRFRF
jgi:II/X family phage/plasmid replication protein